MPTSVEQMGTKSLQNQRSGQIDLFDLMEEEPVGEAYFDSKPYSTKERLAL